MCFGRVVGLKGGGEDGGAIVCSEFLECRRAEGDCGGPAGADDFDVGHADEGKDLLEIAGLMVEGGSGQAFAIWGAGVGEKTGVWGL